MDQRRAAANSRTATWYFAARSRASPERSAVKSQRGPRCRPAAVGVQTSASLSLGSNHAGSISSRVGRWKSTNVKSRFRCGWKVRRREANLDLAFQVSARRAFDLIEPEVV